MSKSLVDLSNERVWAIANVKCKLLLTVKNRKMTFLGHVIRRNSIENVHITNKESKGKKDEGETEDDLYKQRERME